MKVHEERVGGDVMNVDKEGVRDVVEARFISRAVIF